MSSSKNEEVRLSGFRNQKPGRVQQPIKTRSSQKVGSFRKGREGKNSANGPSGSNAIEKVEVRQTTSKKKLKGTSLSPTIVDVVFGNMQNSVADMGELRRKREEDAAKCGRILRSVQHGPSRLPSPKSRRTVAEGNVLENDMTTIHPSASPEIMTSIPQPLGESSKVIILYSFNVNKI